MTAGAPYDVSVPAFDTAFDGPFGAEHTLSTHVSNLVALGIAGVSGSSLAWGDYDNDGKLDVVVTGFDTSFNEIAKVYHNQGSGVFAEISAGLTGVFESSVAWRDYDNDGTLDILPTGQYATHHKIAKIYHTEVG